MGDLIRFVDSIASSPTLRLDLNDESSWWVKKFDAPPPRLRRSVASNAMRDGVYVGSSSYDARTLVIELECRKSTQDLGATEIQKLWRELDRETNYLMYQPTGATKPVFFKTYRSDASQLADIMTQVAMRTVTIEVLAEPFALGLRESVGPFTVTNDPAAGSNGCFFDATGILGDVPAPVVLVNTDGLPGEGVLAVRQHGTPSDLTFFTQCESMTLGTDTTNPGGGPDAAMSGTGTNNYVRTSFATTTAIATRLSWNIAGGESTSAAGKALRGTYRVYAAVRRSGSSSPISLRLLGPGASNDAVATVATTARQLVDLGTISFGVDSETPGGYGVEAPAYGSNGATVTLMASRTSGAETIDWDCTFLIPADECVLLWEHSVSGDLSTYDGVIDGGVEAIYVTSNATNLFAGTAAISSTIYGVLNSPVPAVGGFPAVVPNQTNRFYLLVSSVASLHSKSIADPWTLHYWPRYLFVRPVST